MRQDLDYDRALEEVFEEVRAQMAGQPAHRVFGALLVGLGERLDGHLPPLSFVAMLADMIAQGNGDGDFHIRGTPTQGTDPRRRQLPRETSARPSTALQP